MTVAMAFFEEIPRTTLWLGASAVYPRPLRVHL